MTPGEVVALVVALVGTGGLGAFVETVRSRRRAIAGDERDARRELAEDRRDTIADRDGLIAQLLERVKAMEDWKVGAEERAEGRVRVIRAQGDHIDVLEDHIWRRLPPPPPPRPEGT